MQLIGVARADASFFRGRAGLAPGAARRRTQGRRYAAGLSARAASASRSSLRADPALLPTQ